MRINGGREMRVGMVAMGWFWLYSNEHGVGMAGSCPFMPLYDKLTQGNLR
jgi:hypothetical protein